MRCKACDAELSDVDMSRKDRDGAYMDMCTACFTVSTETLYEDRQNMEALVDAEVDPIDQHPSVVWSRAVAACGAMKRWADGLWGERGELEACNIEKEHYQKFLARVEAGEQPQIAAERTLKITTTNW